MHFSLLLSLSLSLALYVFKTDKIRFCHFPEVLEVLGRSGDLVGTISIYPGTSPVSC